jgi:hypothetical protein
MGRLGRRGLSVHLHFEALPEIWTCPFSSLIEDHISKGELVAEEVNAVLIYSSRGAGLPLLLPIEKSRAGDLETQRPVVREVSGATRTRHLPFSRRYHCGFLLRSLDQTQGQASIASQGVQVRPLPQYRPLSDQ